MKPPDQRNRLANALPLGLLLLAMLAIIAALTAVLVLSVRDWLAIEYVYARLSSPSPTAVVIDAEPTTRAPGSPLPTPTPRKLLAASTKKPSPTIDPTPTRTLPPAPTGLPPPSPLESYGLPLSAQIEGIIGYAQSLTLDCEARSAVDWAAYFGVNISEFEFLDSLPRSDDPNKGFVGDPDGFPQQLPPGSYGVHAAPVADLLRAYGLPAENVYGLDMETLKGEIASGRPVIAWVTAGTQRGYSVDYVTDEGESVRVAPNEHTVIVIGYDPAGVILLDGGVIYWRDLDLFQDSFALLGNMAVIFSP